MAPVEVFYNTLSTLISRASGSSGGGGGGRGGSSSSSSGSSRSGSSGSSSSGGGGGSHKKGDPNAWVKFGKHWVKRWQFGLIVTAIVLAGIALLVVAFMVWRRKHGKKVAVGGNREWKGYMQGLRKRDKAENGGAVEGGGVGEKEMSDSEDEERKKSREGAGRLA